MLTITHLATHVLDGGPTLEFGIFLNGYLPGPAAHDRDCEHTMLTREIEYTIKADRHNWKYAWFGEHHALTEYSHMSAPEVVMGYIAAKTERIHLVVGRSTACPPARSTPSATPSGPPCSTTSPAALRVGHRPGRRQPRDGGVQHPRHQLHEVGVGRGRPRDPPHVGAARLLLRGQALHGAVRRTTSCRSRTGTGTRRSGSPPATRRPSPRPARWASAPSPSTSSRSST